MGYEKRIYMRIKDAMLKEHMPKKYRKREKTVGTLMPAKKEKTMGALTATSENKDSPYSQRFQKERGMTFEFIKNIKNITHLHNLFAMV
jgi:hypothetical protein